jgi:hypothetical protein
VRTQERPGDAIDGVNGSGLRGYARAKEETAQRWKDSEDDEREVVVVVESLKVYGAGSKTPRPFVHSIRRHL